MQFPTPTPLSTVFPQANSVTFRPTSSKHHKVYEKHCGTKQVYVDLNCTNLPHRPLPPCHRLRRRHSLPLPPPRPVPRIIHICHLPAQPRTVHESPTEPITGLGFREPTEDIMNARLFVVFAGPVRWTGKKTEIGPNPTAKDRTTGCSCTNSEFFRLPVAMFVEKSKNRKKPV